VLTIELYSQIAETMLIYEVILKKKFNEVTCLIALVAVSPF